MESVMYCVAITTVSGALSNTRYVNLPCRPEEPPFVQFAELRADEARRFRQWAVRTQFRHPAYVELELLNPDHRTVLETTIHVDGTGQATFYEGEDSNHLSMRRLRWDMEETPDLPEDIATAEGRGGY